MTHDLGSMLRDSADQCPAMPPTLIEDGIRRGQVLHRRRRRATLAVAIAAAVAMAAVVILASGITRPGDDPPSPAPADDLDGLPVLTDGDEVLVSCGGNEGWPPSVMANGVPGLLDQAEATRTFQNILTDPRTAAEAELSILKDGVDVEWRALRGDKTSLVLGLGQWTDRGPTRGHAYVLSLERQNDRWVPTGWGGCSTLAPILREGNTWAHVTGYHAASLDATSLQASVSEAECTGARDPGPFLHEPIVVEERDIVTVYWTSTPIEGGATCPGNPTITRVIALDDPLGDRQVLDGSRYPPQAVEPN